MEELGGRTASPLAKQKTGFTEKTGVQVEEESDERKTDFRGGKLLQTFPSTPQKQVHML